MKKPEFPHCNTLFTISWILTLPILIDISTACSLISFWLVWLFYFLVLIISIIRLWHGFAQKCYKFCFSLLGQLALGAAILVFFQLSFNNVIHTPFSHSVAPDIVEITNPVQPADTVKEKGKDQAPEVEINYPGKTESKQTDKKSEKKYDPTKGEKGNGETKR